MVESEQAPPAEAVEAAPAETPAEAAPVAEFVKPSLEIAQEEALKQRAVRRNEDGSVKELPLDASLDEIGVVLGPGLCIYFKALRALAFYFAGVACTVYAVNILITLAAAGDTRGAILHGVQTLAKVSIYPMQVLYDPVDDVADSTYGPGTAKAFQGADKKDLLVVISVLDVTAMLGLLTGVAAFRRWSAAEEARVDADTLTLDDYSAVVYGLPREALEADEVAAHLQAALPAVQGKVASVFVGKTWGEYLERLSARGAALQALDTLDAKAAATKKDLAKPRAKLQAKLDKLDKEMGGMHEGALVAVCAFVTFTTQAAKEAALKAFPCGALRAALPALQPPARRFRGKHHLRLRPAPEPSTIIWENIQYGAGARQARQAVAGFVTFGLLLITVGFITGAKSYEQEMPPAVSCTGIAADNLLECDLMWAQGDTGAVGAAARAAVDALAEPQSVRECDAYISASSGLWAGAHWQDFSFGTPTQVMPAYAGTAILGCAAKVCQGCFCESSGFFPWLENKNGLYGYCDIYWKNYIWNWFMKGLSIISVIVLNAVFTALIPLLSAFEKLHSRGELNTSIAVKTFLSAFFNAFVITLLVYAFIRDLDQFPLIFKGAYDDFTPAWYASIGSSLVMTTFTQAVQPPVQSAVMGGISSFMRRFQIGSRYTQRDLNALLAGPQWLLATRVAQILTATALALVLCGGFPGAGFLLALCAAFSYKADKYILLRVARAPPRYDASMVHRMGGIIVWCVWLHFGLSAWMFGQAALPAYHLHLADASLQKDVAHADFGQFNVGDRLEKWQCLVQGIPFLIMSVWLFVLRPYGAVTWQLLKPLLPAKLRGEGSEDDDAANGISFPDALAAGKVTGLTSYDPRANPEYEQALRALATKPRNQTAAEQIADASL